MLEGKKNLSDEFGVAKRKSVVIKGSGDEAEQLIVVVHENLSKGSKHYNEAMLGIRTIYTKEVWTPYAETFAEFCQLKLGLSKSTVYQRLRDLAIKEATGEIFQLPNSPPLISNELQQISPESEPLSMSKKEEFKRSTKMQTGTEFANSKEVSNSVVVDLDDTAHEWLGPFLEWVSLNAGDADLRAELDQVRSRLMKEHNA